MFVDSKFGFQDAYRSITAKAKQASDVSGRMVMVYARALRAFTLWNKRCFAYSTLSILIGHQLFKLFFCYPVSVFKPNPTWAFWMGIPPALRSKVGFDALRFSQGNFSNEIAVFDRFSILPDSSF